MKRISSGFGRLFFQRPMRYRLRIRRTGIGSVAILFLLGVPAAGAAQAPATGVCPILDEPHHAWRELDVGYVPPADITGAGWDKTGVVETRLHGMLLYWENDWGGDLDLRAAWDSFTLQGFDGTSSTYTLLMARLSLQWSQRFIGGWGLRAAGYPGVYAALREMGTDGLSVPFGFHLIRNFGPTSSLQVGATVYPGFDVSADPCFMYRKTFRDGAASFDLAYPESRLNLRLTEFLRVFAGARFWAFPEFSMDNDSRERLRFTEARAWAGAEFRFREELALVATGGYAFHRRIRFEGNRQEIELDNAPFFRLGLSWLY